MNLKKLENKKNRRWEKDGLVTSDTRRGNCKDKHKYKITDSKVPMKGNFLFFQMKEHKKLERLPFTDP